MTIPKKSHIQYPLHLLQCSLSKFMLDITDIGGGKHRETWTYKEYKSEIANPPCDIIVISARAFSEK